MSWNVVMITHLLTKSLNNALLVVVLVCNHISYSSRDGVVKLWDVETQHCFQTLVGHRSEVWSIEIIKRETRLLTASGQGGGVKVFSLEPPSVDGRQPDEKVIGPLLSYAFS